MTARGIVALAGNPNSGKSTLFNQLTGLRQRVGNYPGVTVEKKWGEASLGDRSAVIVDLPGTYSLVSRSKEEAIAFEVLSGRTETLNPDVVVIVLDASNLERNLYLALQVMELGRPIVIALNMMDVAEGLGLSIDADRLSARLGVPVVPVVASKGVGVDALKSHVAKILADPKRPPERIWRLDAEAEKALEAIAVHLPDQTGRIAKSAEAAWLLATLAAAQDAATLGTPDDPFQGRGELQKAIDEARARLTNGARTLPSLLIEARYERVGDISREVMKRVRPETKTVTDRIDALLLHRFLGPLVFLAVMTLMFQSIFSWAEPLMDGIEAATSWLGDLAGGVFPEGALRDLVVEGVFAGVGSVLVFIPQIAILFFFIAVLEDSGYLARAAYIMDKVMARVGLHGRAFVPLLSGFACAVPAIMSARTIESTRDRLVTILVTPLMSCSARLPIYILVISALFASDERVFGVFSIGALMMLAMYVISVLAAVGMAFVLKRTILKSPTPPLVLELPPYKMPQLSGVLRNVAQRCKVFLRDAGTVILACSIVLWALLSYPKLDSAASPELARAQQLEHSIGGRLGKLIEPAIEPLGFDWKIGIGLVASFAAREVIVSTLGLIYGIGDGADEENVSLRDAIRSERSPVTGAVVYTPLVGLSLMVFFLFACQCMSTLAIVRRETGGLRWPAFMFLYMTLLAYLASFTVYQGGRLLGLG
jgi:ferrous iron transport protein B